MLHNPSSCNVVGPRLGLHVVAHWTSGLQCLLWSWSRHCHDFPKCGLIPQSCSGVVPHDINNTHGCMWPI
eukprot:1350375-Prorocentrum_lima.AAC.1